MPEGGKPCSFHTAECRKEFIVTLLAKINQEAFEKLSVPLKAEYKKQDDGTYIADIQPVDGFALEDVSGLKSAYSKTMTEKKEALNKLKEFEGVDATKAREALQKLEEMANWKPEQKIKEQIDAVANQLTEKHKCEINTREQAIQGLTKQLEKVLIEAAAIKAITENKGSAELLLPHVKSSARIKKGDNGEFSVEVVDAGGNVRISPAAGSTAPMSISELVTEMKGNKTFAPAFEGGNRGGSGSPAGWAGKGGADVSNMSSIEKMRLARQKNNQT